MDYYSILGVARSASAEEIRKAYKKLARANHPDAKPNDAAASARFKEVQQAYGALGDPEKRALYDRYGEHWEAAMQAGMGPNSPGPTGRAGNPHARPFSSRRPSGGTSPEDMFGGNIDLGDLFGFGRQERRPARGRNIEANLKVPFETAANGGSLDVRLEREGLSPTLSVRIPAGLADGQTIRLSGEGQPGPSPGTAGDLLLKVTIEPHPYFRRDGFDVLVDVPITPSEAVLGAKVEVPTIREGSVLVTIPPGTSSGVKLRLRGRGIVNPQTQQPGDGYVVVKIVVPRDPEGTVLEMYKQLAPLESAVRQGLW